MKRSPSKACSLPVRRLYSKKSSKTKRPDNRYFKIDNSHAKIGVSNMFILESTYIGGYKLIASNSFISPDGKDVYFNFSAKPGFEDAIVFRLVHKSEPPYDTQPIRLSPLDNAPNTALIELINYDRMEVGEALTSDSPILLVTVGEGSIKQQLFLILTVRKLASPTGEISWQYDTQFISCECRYCS